MKQGLVELPANVAIVVVAEHEGRFLLIEEDRGSPQGRVWYFPSGALEAGETIADAARREGREESGYDIEPRAIIAIDHGTFTNPAGLHWWRLVVSGRLASRVPQPVEEQDVTGVAWLNVEQIGELRLRNGDAARLCHASEGDGLPLECCRFFAGGQLDGFYG